MTKKDGRGSAPIAAEQVSIYRRVHPALKSLLDEMRELSKKQPDVAVNKFKLGFVNEKLQEANVVLGDQWRPLKTFLEFDLAALPSNSDVVIILSQYLGSLNRWHTEHTHRDHLGKRVWKTDPPLPAD